MSTFRLAYAVGVFFSSILLSRKLYLIVAEHDFLLFVIAAGALVLFGFQYLIDTLDEVLK